MAEIKNKQDIQRTRLETAIPIDTPYTLMLAVASSCNYRCSYCPCSRPNLLKNNNIKKGIMDYRIYKKIIDDLDEFTTNIKVLRLQLQGEPLLNRKLVDMIRYAKKKQPRVKIDTTTNASMLTRPLSDSLIDSGLDKIFISLQGMSAEAYKTVTGVETDFDKLLENVIYFCTKRKQCKVYVKVPDISVNASEKERFLKIFDNYADEMFVENIIPTWPDFDISKIKKDNGIGYYGEPVDPDYIWVCPLIFYDMIIDFDGKVLPCPVDWIHKTDLGNAGTQHLYELWNGKKLNDLRRLHLRKQRASHPLCGKCVTLEYCNVDKIDNHAEMLLDRFASLP